GWGRARRGRGGGDRTRRGQVTGGWKAWLAAWGPSLTLAVRNSGPVKPAFGVIVSVEPLTLTVACPWPGWALTSRLGLALKADPSCATRVPVRPEPLQW